MLRLVRTMAALWIAAAASTAVPAVAAAPADRGPPAVTATEFLFGIPPGLDLKKIVDKPRIVELKNYVFTDPVSGERRLAGHAEVVAVYDMPIEDILAVALDFESYPDYAPRIMETNIQERDGTDYHLYYKVGIRFLGIEVSYRSTFRTKVEHFEGKAVGIRSTLVESLDESEFEHFTSLYFSPVTVDGKTMTFIRYFNRPGIRNPSAGMLQVLNLFLPPEARGQVAAIARQARRLSGRD